MLQANRQYMLLALSVLCCATQLDAKAKPCASIPNKVGHFFRDIVIDIIDLHVNLFSVESAKVVTGILPFYLTARFIDEDLQSRFYNQHAHTNKNQLPKQSHAVAKSGVGIPMVLLSSTYFWGWTDDIRYTGWMTGIGLPFVQSGKDVIKRARAKACLRPWHEDFNNEKRSSGGFPSGHMANIAYMTTLWGLRHGPRWAFPIGVFGVFVLVDFINCNRHYLSQMIAGAGLGMIYGFAASKVVDKKLSANWCFDVSTNLQGDTCLQVSYKF